MATPIIRDTTVIGIEEESTEGTFVAPQANTSYIQPLADGFEMAPARELVERNLLNSSLGKETPRLGKKSVNATLPVEFRASGTEGAAPDFTSLLKGALGSVRTNTAETTTTSNTSTVLNFSSHGILAGDIVLVEEAGAFEMRPVASVTSTTVTLAFALTNGAPSDGVAVSALSTYLTADSGHPSLSVSYYWGNQIRQAALGCRVTSMALENFAVGQIASLNFGLQGFNFTEADGAAPHTPSFDSGVPPIILSACVFRAGTSVDVTNVGLELTNTLGMVESTCSANGVTAQRVVSREITGSFNPFKDDTATTYFDDWVGGTEFSMFLYAYNPSSTAGEIDLGSAVGIWLPQCFTTEFKTEDANGILVDQMGFRATRGSAGTSEEMYVGLV